ncbi:MAG: glycosidase, partial [Ignavibacteria bacterium]
MIRRNPAIYEINTRVWLRRFDTNDKKASLKDVPFEYWRQLKEKGIDAVWLMGIWKTNKEIVKDYCFEDGLKKEYSKALKDWREEDVIGSPFAIDVYEVDPGIGVRDDILSLRLKLNDIGMKLILDFVPNHFSIGSRLLQEHPEIFLSAPHKFWEEDSHTFYHDEQRGLFFAHGRDPFFPAWQDTLQVNYFSDDARKFMIEQLYNISMLCDGVRCDMAMLMLNNVFANNWGQVLSQQNYNKPSIEFWKLAIDYIRDFRPDFIFIAEAYWDLEYELQQLGFDYTYDKKLTDRLKAANVMEIRAHLNADYNYQTHSLRFIENHDEERAFNIFGQNKSKAAAVIISTIIGMRFYYDGQWEGKRIKLPVQLGREPEERRIEQIVDFYDKLLSITKEDVFHEGKWIAHYPIPAGPGDESFHNMLAWCWEYENERRLVVVNFSDSTSRCRLKLNLEEYKDEFILTDLLNNNVYS